ncbi:MAG: GNAT family N-acetyltransferase/peptidase C39 family protein [Rhodobiaceae bacterium]|nr:GNAT family N-acetyltransferase/peptidase C39 family protein [Rhodobiaceae bacterium]MCC0015899.1 GNAT family N-acetyltransferase/peptidase C39 family protein [Rhodobiaceae bacterium]MCC0040684.1 GNAT family N-acetyltransferase/peptidase C39 family protein [Rhodobiaceae bacterium]
MDAHSPTTTCRPARIEDLEALVVLETSSFTADRISRRSFRQFLRSPTAQTIVAINDGVISGYALILYRAGTAMARLYSIAVADRFRGRGIGLELLEEAEHAAFEAGRFMMRLEVREDNAGAIALYKAHGYRQFGTHPDYYEDHATALRFERILRAENPPPAPPFYEQQTDFTCGAASVMMARARFDPTYNPTIADEIRIWRAATMIYMASGLGGCGPYGLSLQLADMALSPRIWVSMTGNLFLDTVRNDDKRKVMKVVQEDFRRQVTKRHIPVEIRAFTSADLAVQINRGAAAIVLISGYRMFGKKVPHWVFAHSADDGHIFVHDPWVEDKRGETIADAANLPIPFAEFDRMARFGRDRLSAAIIIRKD